MSVTPQNVLDSKGNNTIFTVWNFNDQICLKEPFQQLCALVINLNHSTAVRFPDNGASVVLGISMTGWNALGLGASCPKELNDFKEIIGVKRKAVATRGDLHFHIRGVNSSICYDLAAEIAKVLDGVADCVVEVNGFKYWDGRSVFGFVDGTENPGESERPYYGLIGDDEPEFKGGSYLFVQKYIHDLKSFKQLSLEEQEKVFGRYKESDIEMEDDIKPTNSHSALANVGEEFKVIRDNMPFGNISTNEMGTYFIAYASTFSTVNKMLQNMYIGNPPGNYDRLLDFSIAMTGTLFFVPSMNMLAEMSSGDFAVKVDTNAVEAIVIEKNKSSKTDGSLGIGALKSKK